MEQNNTETGDSQSSKKSPETSDNAEVNSEAKTANKRQAESRRGKKWSLLRHWRAATRKEQFRWIAELIGVLIALGVLTTYIIGNLQTKWHMQMEQQHFSMEHRPRLEFFREPALVDPFSCSVDQTAIRWRSGRLYVWVKNIRTGDAINAFIVGPQLQLVPDPNIGNKEIDTVMPVSEETCGLELKPTMKTFPLNAGQETMLEGRQGVGARSLIPTK